MGTLNPNIPDAKLARLMTEAGDLRESYRQKLLTPQLLLRIFLENQESSAHRILVELSKQRGFDWDDLTRRVEMMAKNTAGRNANFYFTDDF